MNRFIISQNASILKALECIEINSPYSTLLVVDGNAKLLATVSDGDIRRYLIKGGSLSDSVLSASNENYHSITLSDANYLRKIKEYKLKRIKLVPIVSENGALLDVIDLVHFHTILPFDAVLMAGGKGERLRPLTDKLPKPLVKVGDKCIIDYNIDRLIEYGVKHINVTVNYLKEQLQEHFSVPRNGIKVETVEEPKYLGTIGSIQFIKEFHNDTILVMNSDLFTNIDFEDFYLHFIEHDAMMSVAAVPYNVNIPYGILDLEGRNIKGLLEKPKYNYYANGGIYLIKRESLNFIPVDEYFNATDLIQKLISMGKSVIRYPLNGTWIDIGQHADLEKARVFVKHLK